LVFVCAMWLTGFDAPSCSTVYLDKPMRNHTLMQTIARANRVYPGKHSGVIVDYANVFESLERPSPSTGRRATQTPVRDKDGLVDELRAALVDLDGFCASAGVGLERHRGEPGRRSIASRASSRPRTLSRLEERRKAFLAQARLTERLYAAIKPHKRASEFAVRMSTVAALAEKIRAETAPEKTDIDRGAPRIGEVLDRSIAGAAITTRDGPPAIDLSRIDFKALAAKFKASKTKNLDVERLKAAIRAQLDRLIAANETRVDFREKFEALIEAYNAGSMQIEQLFRELLELTRTLTDEEARHVRENLTEEELVVFDLLTRPVPT
jgi:type I restriction enzyme R subunit